MKFLVLLTIFAASSAALDLKLNDMCRGTLFSTLSHPTNKNLFIGCVQGKGTILACHEPDDVFNPMSVSCHKEGDVPPPPPSGICSGVLEGLRPFPDSCEFFVRCVLFVPFVDRCPENSIFNPSILSCVPGSPEDCEALTPPTEPPTDPPTWPPTDPPTDPPTWPPTEPPTREPTWPPTNPPTTSNPGDVQISFHCPSSGFGNIPNATDCRRYFECIQGVRNNRTCPGGLIFDVITSQCNDVASSLCAVNIRCA